MNKEQYPSLQKLAEIIVTNVQEIIKSAKTEEDLKIAFEKILDPLLQSIGVQTKPKYESLSTRARTICKGRPDAVHGQIIIEYETPNSLSDVKNLSHAYEQLVSYLIAEMQALQDQKTDPMLLRFAGIGFDGSSIFFVQNLHEFDSTEQLGRDSFRIKGPYPFNPESARTFLTYMRSLSRLPLTAENLAERFGPDGKVARLAVSAFLDSLENWKSEKVNTYFNEWKRLFGIVYGEQLGSFVTEDFTELFTFYSLDKKIDFQKSLFCVHTYFAFLLKLISMEILSQKESVFNALHTYQLTHISKEDLILQLNDIENGGVYSRGGITNFLEGDFFSWYLDALSPRLEEALREIARELSNFEPASTIISAHAVQDLLKRLYQYLIPQEVRHKLGEYYTPDWLAEFILEEVGYDGNLKKRLLDPACGSGTFIVHAIQLAKKYAHDHNIIPIETVKNIVSNIYGFDLNPLAIIASRTNYLFALGELVNYLDHFEIPIYLADSVLWPEKTAQLELNCLGGEHLKVPTSIGQFRVPNIWVKGRGFLMNKAAYLVTEMSKLHYIPIEAMERLKNEGLVFPPHEQIVQSFYEQILELEIKGKNGIWSRFLKNAFAPSMSGKFDYVVGNPPWIRWGYLSKEYREATLKMWQEYGLFSLKGSAARLGGGEKDFSMLFTYAVIDYYLENGGKLGFLITQEVFKSKGAGEGFRRFQLGERDYFQVLKAHDLITVQPFEQAANKTAAIILKKGSKTKYPIPYTLWTRKKGVGKIPTDLNLQDAIKFLNKEKLIAKPIGSKNESWQTIKRSQKELNNIKGDNFYLARRGASTEPYGVFWLKIKQVMSNGDLLVENLPEKGKRKIHKIEERIESEHVYPSISGSDLIRWCAIPKVSVLIVQDPQKREPYNMSFMKSNYPRTYGYLSRFKDILLSRGSNTVRELAEKTEFYAMYGIGSYTFSNYKVVWKRMTNDIHAAVISQFKTEYGYKTVIPTDTTSFFALDNEYEAHYICALINSLPVREFIRSYSSSGRGFGAPSVMKHVGIPKFDPNNKLHQKLSQVSKTLHDLKPENKPEQVQHLENEVDDIIVKLFS
jgi:type I restriction-modification system DNA methylase subunit